MRRISKVQWDALVARLNAIRSDADPNEIFTALQDWLRSNRPLLLDRPYSDYRLEEFCDLEASDYPIHLSDVRNEKFQVFRRNLLRYEGAPTASVAAFLNKFLERLIMIFTDDPCASCGYFELPILRSEPENVLTLECPVCGACFNLDGRRSNAEKLTFARTVDLRRENLPT